MSAGLTGGAVRSFAWSALSVGSNRVVAFVATLLLARLLGPEQFGIAAAALVLVAFLDAALDLGVSASVVYEQEDGHSRRLDTAFTVNQLAAAALTGVALLAAPYLADFLQVPGSVEVFQVLALVLLVRGAGQVHDALLKRGLQFRRRMVAEVSRALVRAVVSVGLALGGLEVWSIVWGYLAAELTGTVALWLLVGYRPRPRLDREVAASLLRFGAAFSGLRIVNALFDNADMLVVGNVFGPTALGVYNMAMRIPTLLVANALFVFSTVAFPVYSRARKGGGTVLVRAMHHALMLTSLFGLTTGTGLALVASDAVQLTLGPQWSAAALPMALLSLSIGVSAIGYASGDIFPAIGRPGLLLWLNIPTGLVTVAALLVGSRYGLVGVAIAHLISTVGYVALRMVVAARLVGGGLGGQVAQLWPGVVASVGIVVLALPVRHSVDGTVASLVTTILAGVLGALLALVLGARGPLRSVVGLLRRAVVQRTG